MRHTHTHDHAHHPNPPQKFQSAGCGLDKRGYAGTGDLLFLLVARAVRKDEQPVEDQSLGAHLSSERPARPFGVLLAAMDYLGWVKRFVGFLF